MLQSTLNTIRMKRIAILLSALIIASAGLFAQKTNNLKTDLFSPILRTFVLKYEIAFNPDMSGQLGFFYTGFKPSDLNGSITGFGITPEFRYYLSETPAPNGTYLAPNVRYMNLKAKDNDSGEQATLTVLGFAINVGKQVLLKDLILIDGWIGPSYNFRTIEETSIQDIGIPDANGFGLRLGIAIGIAF